MGYEFSADTVQKTESCLYTTAFIPNWNNLVKAVSGNYNSSESLFPRLGFVCCIARPRSMRIKQMNKSFYVMPGVHLTTEYLMSFKQTT